MASERPRLQRVFSLSTDDGGTRDSCGTGSGERVSLEIRSTMIAQTENKTLRETERIAAEHFPEAMQAAGSQSFSSQNFSKQNYSNQIVFTDEQIKLLERVRELKSHANFGASLAEIE